jgi:hypothetical protein
MKPPLPKKANDEELGPIATLYSAIYGANKYLPRTCALNRLAATTVAALTLYGKLNLPVRKPGQKQPKAQNLAELLALEARDLRKIVDTFGSPAKLREHPRSISEADTPAASGSKDAIDMSNEDLFRAVVKAPREQPLPRHLATLVRRVAIAAKRALNGAGGKAGSISSSSTAKTTKASTRKE